MRRLNVERLSWEAFLPFGTYLDPADCGVALGNDRGPVRFYPDRMLLGFEAAALTSISPLVLAPRALEIDRTEIHLRTEEAIGGFTRDVVFHVGPAGAREPDPARMRVFHLPAGWWVRLKRGVWHHAPFVLGGEETVGIVVLPPATYTNDCLLVTLEERIAVSTA
ncbi:MAG: ureidoglycolate lyase [Bacteroidota bacterium]